MKIQVKLYVQRQLSNALISGTGSRFEVTGSISLLIKTL